MNAQEILNNIRQMKTEDPTVAGMNKLKSALTGGTIGFIGGAMIGYAKKWSVLWTGVMGALIGATIIVMVAPKKD